MSRTSAETLRRADQKRFQHYVPMASSACTAARPAQPVGRNSPGCHNKIYVNVLVMRFAVDSLDYSDLFAPPAGQVYASSTEATHGTYRRTIFRRTL